MTAKEGWSALQQGRIDEAVRLLKQAADDSPQDAAPLLGLAQALLTSNHLDQAESMVRLANQRGAPPEAMLVQSQVLGERGQRDAATNMLRQYLQRGLPNRPLALSLLAEQRIRQGYWDEGTDLLIEAIKQDPHGVASIHMEKITTDMTLAVAGRKIRPVEVLKFLNKIDYSVPKSPEQSARLASYRRAINSGTAPERFTQVAPALPHGLSAEAPPAPATTSAPAAPALRPPQPQSSPARSPQSPQPQSPRPPCPSRRSPPTPTRRRARQGPPPRLASASCAAMTCSRSRSSKSGCCNTTRAASSPAASARSASRTTLCAIASDASTP